MSEKKTVETIELECSEEQRTARLMIEWTEEDGTRKLTGVQCDNPRLQTLDNWQCEWSCWEKVKRELEGRDD